MTSQPAESAATPAAVAAARHVATPVAGSTARSTAEPITAVTLRAADWLPLAAAHAQRADAFTAAWRARRQDGTTHAIEDFLFTYYPTKPALLRRWHPGTGVVLAGTDEDLTQRAGWRWHSRDDDGVWLDRAAFLTDRGEEVAYIRDLLTRMSGRPANLGCFGLHEWAMVYRQADQTRHPLPLRLSAAGTDQVVEAHPIRCSHFDAFRFFTPEAVPLNRLQPTRQSAPALEQPGCLHAGMDTFKWASKLGPALSGDVLLDAFELARDIRTLDMQASPYDVSQYGLEAVAIETPEGKAVYSAQQREFSRRAAPIRARIVAACENLLG